MALVRPFAASTDEPSIAAVLLSTLALWLLPIWDKCFLPMQLQLHLALMMP